MRIEQTTGGWQAADGGYPLRLATFSQLRNPNLRERLLLTVAGVFVLLGAATLSLVGLDHWSTVQWSLVGVWIVCFGAAHLVLCRHAPEREPLLLPLAGLLSGWGLLLIARLADVTFLLRQSIWLAVSTAVFLAIAARPPSLRWLRRYRYTWLLGGLALLATTLVLGTNPSGFGPRLWLGGRLPGLGNVFIQPSEILKLLMVAYLSSYLAEKRELVLDGPQIGWGLGRWPWLRQRPAAPRQEEPDGASPSNSARRVVQLPSVPYLAPLLAMWGLAMVLLAWQQDLGAALLFFFTFLVMLYQASGRWVYVLVGLALFFVASAGAYLFLDTVALRVDIWLNPWSDPNGRAFQVVQSLIAFASGGLIGQGLGQGSPTYIPAIHTDFPFSAIAEEFGLLGVAVLIAVFVVLTLRGLHIALNARTSFRQLLAAGLAALLGLQAWIIMAGNSKLIPLTGVTLPFVSYGGSSLLSSFIALALLTTISRDEGARRLSGDGERSSAVRAGMAGPIWRMGFGFLATFAGLAIICGYWALVRHDALWTRDDNPRLVEAEQRVKRGPILDRHNVVLARSQPDENGRQQRTYLAPTIPAVGYYSLKHGVGGIEASADTLLRGLEGYSDTAQFFDELLHRQPRGRGIVLTLDAALHQDIAAIARITGITGIIEETDDALARTDGVEWRGAIVLADIKSGAVLALESWPIYDPNTLDEDWEQLDGNLAAPLLNRATQGLYQPGGALQLIVLAAALDAGMARLDASANDPTAPVIIDGQPLGCIHVPAGKSLADAIAAGCVAPIAELGEALGPDLLEQAFQRWGLGRAQPLEIETGADEVSVIDPRLAAVGQESLTVTPLHLAMVMAAIGNQGVMSPPHIVLRTEGANGRWQEASPEGQAARAIGTPLAERLRQLLSLSQDGRVSGYTSLALAGADRPAHVWFVGLAPAQAPQYAIAVLLEHAGQQGLELAETIGHDALVAALDQIP